MAKPMKLSKFAELHNISYGTAYKHWQKGMIIGQQLETGTILAERYRTENDNRPASGNNAILYARVNSTKNTKSDTDLANEQLAELEKYAISSGYNIVDKAAETGMGLDPNRRRLVEILNRTDWDILVVKDRETAVKYSAPYLEAALASSGRKIEYLEVLDTSAENVTLKFINDVRHLLHIVRGVSKKHIIEALERMTA